VIVAPSTPLGIEALPARESQPLLDAGAAGLCLPADALVGPEALRRVAPLLERLAARDVSLLVHPGSATDLPGPPGGRR
jgi:hypothetical protein